MTSIKAVIAATSAVLVLAACGEKSTDAGASATAGGSGELEKMVVKAEPPQSQPVMAAKAKPEGEDVVVRGKVKDIVEGAAVFVIADESLKECTPDECETPWDYCCETAPKISEGTATVRIVDATGGPVRENLKGVNDFDHMTTVTVEGKIAKDDAGNVTIEAKKVYVQGA